MIKEKHYYVYIMANKQNGTLYTGVTNDLVRRVNEHRNNLVEGFTKRYGLHKLVYFEATSDIDSALNYEKQVKDLSRAKKLILIENVNPQWDDLWNEISQ
jgi:putative endonuclease